MLIVGILSLVTGVLAIWQRRRLTKLSMWQNKRLGRFGEEMNVLQSEKLFLLGGVFMAVVGTGILVSVLISSR